MHSRRTTVVVAALLGLLLPQAAASSRSEGIPVAGSLETLPLQQDYILGAEDLLDIKIVGVDALSSTVRIASSGNISLPLLGELPARGLTSNDLERSIAQRLGDRYINDPQVSVFVKEYGSRKISVLGAVKQPGRYPMIGRRTLLDLISDAGGLTDEAGPVAVITHPNAGPDLLSRASRVDLEALLYGGRSELNPEIGPGDLIHIPVDRAMLVYVEGAVKEPGEFSTPASRPLTVLQAVTKAGGVSDRAALKKVEILRRQADGGQISIPVNLKEIRRGKAEDILLRDGDIVVVPETYF